MSYNIPTLQELYAAHLARLESQIGQASPLNDKAFLRILAATEAGLDIGHYKFAADAALQSFALTATNSGLDRIGLDNSTPRKQAETAIIEAELPATTGTVIPAGTEFTSDSSGIRYRTDVAYTSVGGIATLNLRSVVIGTDGNLDNGETLSISAQIAGADTVATVISTITLGVNAETDAEYRPRVLFAQRAVTGGANATDHKIWAEAVAGVRRAFPYAGRPVGVSFPGDRTVYVEATTSVDPDGIAPLPLLAAVRADINTDPDTGLSRLVLGLTDATLWVESIYRTPIYVEIRNLDVDPAQESTLKSDITAALTLYFQSIAPFVDGVDLPQERTDTITTFTVSEIVQDVMSSYGAFAQGIGFGVVPAAFLTLYMLNPGELAKLGSVTYV
jgi:uncharacterized phage protein gp47/JayE